jgi:hypothetical protein
VSEQFLIYISSHFVQTPCSSVGVNCRFRWTCCIHINVSLEASGSSETWYQHTRLHGVIKRAFCLLLAGYLLGLLFALEDNDSMFLRNVDEILTLYDFTSQKITLFVTEKIHTIENTNVPLSRV